MRNAIILAGLVIVGSLIATDANASCQRVCRYTPYGTECRHVCYAPPRPQYVPDRSYNTPALQPQPNVLQPDVLFSLIVLVAIGGIALVIALSSNSSSPDTSSYIVHFQDRTAHDNAMRAQLEADVAAARRYIEAERARAFQRGYHEG